MSERRCDYVKDDGSVCGQQCNEPAEWWFCCDDPTNEDDSEYEEFVVCSRHLTDMLEPGLDYIVHSYKEHNEQA